MLLKIIKTPSSNSITTSSVILKLPVKRSQDELSSEYFIRYFDRYILFKSIALLKLDSLLLKNVTASLYNWDGMFSYLYGFI